MIETRDDKRHRFPPRRVRVFVPPADGIGTDSSGRSGAGPQSHPIPPNLLFLSLTPRPRLPLRMLRCWVGVKPACHRPVDGITPWTEERPYGLLLSFFFKILLLVWTRAARDCELREQMFTIILLLSCLIILRFHTWLKRRSVY